MFAQQELDTCWVLRFVDRRAHTRRSSGALAHLHAGSARRAEFIPLPHLQVRVGGFSPHVMNLTPIGCLF